MTTHISGAISSPSCSAYGLRSLAKEFVSKYSNDVLDFISNNFYVEDGLKSVHRVEDATNLISRTVTLCRESEVCLYKFSNSEEVLKYDNIVVC